ncbi:MAG TPA: class I SAM-dependent methyltransferase [Vicinamibacterales bacterium]
MQDPSRYIRRQMSAVDGWLHRTSAEAIAALGRGGNAAEIGVHHGKLFILLSLLCDHAYAIDVFDSALNVDESGAGDRGIFERNMARYGGRYTIIQRDSAQVSPAELPPIRLFSVDGAHTAAMTEHDLRLAAEVLVPGGVIILDDYFNDYWPDVSVGANRVLAEGKIFPFAITPGKVLLTNADPEPHLAALARSAAFVAFRDMAGHRVALLQDEHTALLQRVMRTGVYRRVRAQPWFAPVKRLGRRMLG